MGLYRVMKRLAAIICLTTAVLLGSVGVSESADYQKGFTAYKSGDYATALREWTPLAKEGNADAQFNLGLMYDEGQGVPEDNMKAVHWYRFAAWQGHACAQGNLGAMYALGAGVKKDLVRARHKLGWYWAKYESLFAAMQIKRPQLNRSRGWIDLS